MRDLFADDDEDGVWFEDPALLDKLAMAKLGAAADELATRWKWAVPMVEVDWSTTARHGRVHPQPSPPTGEEQTELAKLETRQDELVNLDEDDWTAELAAEAEAVEDRLDAIAAAVEARAVFRAEDFAMAGCIVTIGHDGAMQVIQGLVRPEDMPAESGEAATQAGNGRDPDAATADQAGHTAASPVAAPLAGPKDREAEARREAGVGIGLADDLRSIRSALVKAHLARDFEAAFDLALFQMGRALFAPGYHNHALDIAVKETPDRPMTRMNDPDFAEWSPGEAMLADRSGLSLDWLDAGDDDASFAALRVLPQTDKQALFAACVARTVKGQLAFEPQARPELEATVARLGIDFAAHVRPTAGMLWSRMPKGRILDVARTVFGAAWASARSKYRKPALAEAMEAAFAAGRTPARALGRRPRGRAGLDAAGVRRLRCRADQRRRRERGRPLPETQRTPNPRPSRQPMQSTRRRRPPRRRAGSRLWRASSHRTPRRTGPKRSPPAPTATVARRRPKPGRPTAIAADADHGSAGETSADPDAIAGTGPIPPVPANGHDAHADPAEIPEFLRQVR